MRSVLFFLLCIHNCGFSQTLCGTAGEGGTVTLTAPAGNVFTNIEFASYGTPNGSCGAYTISGCHAANSVSICSSALVGVNSATISATNGVFGDPCVGTVKRLYITARYDAVLPLKLVSFSGMMINGTFEFSWKTEDEINTSEFMIEQSLDGLVFKNIGKVRAAGSGANSYNLKTTADVPASHYYFRLKMTDHDTKFQYSNIIRISNTGTGAQLAIYQDISGQSITAVSDQNNEAAIINGMGKIIRRMNLKKGTQNININELIPGLYFIRSGNVTRKFLKR